MIEHVDAALRSWFTEQLDVANVVSSAPDVATVSPPKKSKGAAPTAVLHVQLAGLTEQQDRRDNDVSDIRDDQGRVVARQRSMRYFAVDYWCSVVDDPTTANRVLGQLIHELVDHDIAPPVHVPNEISELGVPLTVELSAEPSPGGNTSSMFGGVMLRVVVPFQPSAEHDVAPPAVAFHLDVAPAPEPTVVSAAADASTRSAATGEANVEGRPREWTAVRRREFIARPIANEQDRS